MMLSFDQLAEPSEGWTLDRMCNRRSLQRDTYWDVELIDEVGAVVSGQHKDLETAWEQAVRAAHSHDCRQHP